MTENKQVKRVFTLGDILNCPGPVADLPGLEEGMQWESFVGDGYSWRVASKISGDSMPVANQESRGEWTQPRLNFREDVEKD